jgi:hypothetical protein
MWDALAAIQLIETLLHRSEKLNTVGDLVEGAVVRQLADCLQDNFLLCYGKNYAAKCSCKASVKVAGQPPDVRKGSWVHRPVRGEMSVCDLVEIIANYSSKKN